MNFMVSSPQCKMKIFFYSGESHETKVNLLGGAERK